MEWILHWGIDVIKWFQQASPLLDLPFLIFTYTGDQMFFILFFPLVIWSIDHNFGLRLTIIFLLSSYLNTVAKLIVDQPRPGDIDGTVKVLVHETSGGLPSGHTQSATVVWGMFIREFREKWVRWLAIIMILFVPLSRIYLGAHFPTDILGGYLLGILVLLMVWKLEKPLIQWLSQASLFLQISISILLPLLLIPLMPSWDSTGFTICGVMVGGGVGICLEKRYLKFSVSEVLWKRPVCYLLGVSILMAIYIGLKVLFSGLEPEPFFRFLRYLVLGLYIVLIAPWIFQKLNLANSDS